MARWVLFLLIFLSFLGCNSTPDEKKLNPKEFKSALIEIHLLESYYASLRTDSNIKVKLAAGYQDLYKRLHIDSAILDSSIKFYAQHPASLLKIYEEVDSFFIKKRDSLEKH